ncbi:hypothetical protein K2173_014712 [Erythroxylum novogranatense]|uniref:NAB domain-containing protein n=1 Tax=Erythroxylum novogranatense TaxID=1862640 RepID=A0AAV8TH50_9ROSI|nr:hypothetical protein K2173_014712 [Erythroxylum novogranatense]
MLQRAASNAYSWWWASHIRTKQSKWLEQNLQDMEEKVHYMLKLIEEDGDSFAKRAEMYYKKRPELISFVEESYRAYRALAERYDHISTELQNANNTIAYVFPEQVQFAMEEDEDEPSPKVSKKPPEMSKGNIPKVPKVPKDFRGAFTSAAKKLQPRKSMKGITPSVQVFKSGLSKAEGLQRIDKLQKEILSLQTEKEFVKSSYEGGVAKYWEIEQEIKELQEKVCALQDEFGAGIIIEDDEARTLMASAALKSCQETLAQLQEKHAASAKEAVVERERISHAREKLKSLKDVFLNGQVIDPEKLQTKDEPEKVVEELKSSDQEANVSTRARRDLEMLQEKIKEHFDVGFNSPLTVTELAEKIDELVNKVISLESAISSQTALTKRLRLETDELQSQIQTLEDDKTTLMNDKNEMSIKLREMEEKLLALQDLNKSVEEQNNNLQTHFTEAHCNLDHLSGKMYNVKPDEELDITKQMEKEFLVEFESQGSKQREGSEVQLQCQEESKGQEGSSINYESREASKREEGSPAAFESQEGNRNHEEVVAPIVNSDQSERVNSEAESKISGYLTQLDAKGQGGPTVELESQEMSNTYGDSLVNFECQQSEAAPNDVKELADVTPETELNILENKYQEQEDAIPGESFKEPQEVRISDSLQKEENYAVEVGLPGEQEKQKDLDFRETTDSRTKDEEVAMEDPRTSKSDGESVGPFQSSTGNLVIEEKVDDTQAQRKRKDDEPDWKDLFTNGMENREKVLLTEYTTVLRNYKEAKKKLAEAEQSSGDSLFNTTLQLRELKTANAKKDEQIQFLRQKLSLLQAGIGEPCESEEPTMEEEDDIEAILMNLPECPSEIEQRFRSHIDEVLEENLDFWLRFSATYHQIQKFGTEIKDLQSELSKLDDKRKKLDGSSAGRYFTKSDAKPIYKHLREIQAELTVWLEKSALLKDELQSRFSSLCDIQEEIKAALKESAEYDDFKFTTHQAAKFQGEVLNMKQENNKVADELQAGLDHVTALKLELDRTLAKVNEEYKLSGQRSNQPVQLQHSETRSHVPLHSFIFGVKPKKQRHSFFSRVQPALHKKYNDFKSGPM